MSNDTANAPTPAEYDEAIANATAAGDTEAVQFLTDSKLASAPTERTVEDYDKAIESARMAGDSEAVAYLKEQRLTVASPRPDFHNMFGGAIQGSGAYQITDWLMNSDVVAPMMASIGGGLAGGVISKTPAGVIGGSGAGVGALELAQDAWNGRELDKGNAFSEAALDVAINTAVGPGGAALLRTGPGQAVKEAAGKYVVEPVKKAATPYVNKAIDAVAPAVDAVRGLFSVDPMAPTTPYTPKPPAAAPPTTPRLEPVQGTPESLGSTQQMLSQGGSALPPVQGASNGSLSRQQAGTEGVKGWLEEASSQTMFGKGVRQDIVKTNDKVLGSEVDKLRGGPVLADEGKNVGQVITDTVRSGAESTNVLYRRGMDEVNERVGTEAVTDLKGLQGVLKGIRDKLGGEKVAGTARFQNSTTLDSLAKKEINKMRLDISKIIKAQRVARAWNKANPTKTPKPIPQYDIKSLQARLRTLNTTASEAMKDGQVTAANTQILEVRRQLSDYTQTVLDGLDPAAADIFRQSNKLYNEGLASMKPKINEAATKAALYKGRTTDITDAVRNANPEEIVAYYGTIEEAYRLKAKELNIHPKSKQAREIQIGGKTQAQARGLVRQEYINKLFGGAGGDTFNPEGFITMAETFKDPEKIREAKAILGPDMYNDFKRLINAIGDTSTKKSGEAVGSLALRQQEFNAGRGLLTANGSLGTALLFFPYIAAKVVSRPSKVNKIIAELNKPKRAGKVGSKAFTEAQAQTTVRMTALIEAMMDEPDGDQE